MSARLVGAVPGLHPPGADERDGFVEEEDAAADAGSWFGDVNAHGDGDGDCGGASGAGRWRKLWHY